MKMKMKGFKGPFSPFCDKGFSLIVDIRQSTSDARDKNIKLGEFPARNSALS